MKKAISIARISSTKQKDNTSISAQHDICSREAACRGYSIVETFSEQKSGRGVRDTVQQAFDFAKAYNAGKGRGEQVQLLLVQVWDRWFRNRDLAGYWNYKFSEIGVTVNAAQQWEDSADSGSIILTGLHLSMAEAESRKNSERTKRGIYYTVRAGKLPGTPPRGYLRSNELDGDGRQRKVVRHPELAPKYRQAFTLIAEGVDAIVAYRQLGGRKTFGAKQTFYDALKNEVYCGRKKHKSPFAALPDLNVQLNFEPIVDYLTFRKVQQRLDGYGSRRRRVEVDEQFYARSVTRCPSCGSAMTSESSKGRSRVYHYYRCAADYRHFRVRRDQVHRFLPLALRDLSLSLDSRAYLEERAAERIEGLRGSIGQMIGQLRRDLGTAEERQRKALTLFVDGAINSEEYDIYRSDVDRIQAEIGRQEYIQENQGQLLGRVMDFVSDLPAVYDTLRGVDRMALLQMVFPVGFYIEHQKPSDPVGICRTARINSIFAIMSEETRTYERIKLESPANLPGFPVEGGRPDDNRTAIIAEDFRAFQLFHLRLAA